ncbi:MAG: hypothetical protein QHH01_04430 [Spirochaetales bacterium]|nr:hypothetical protein [Spirochaetales bacterium]
MVARSRLVVMSLVLMFALGSIPVHSQQQVHTAEGIPASLQKLASSFNVDVVLLTSLYEQGYTPGEIWLALAIMQASDTSLEEAIPLAADAQGHGWGVLAAILEIAPGSEAFHALKFDWQGLGTQDALQQTLQQQIRTRQQAQLRTMVAEHQLQNETAQMRQGQSEQHQTRTGQNNEAGQAAGNGNQTRQQGGQGNQGGNNR